MNRNAFVGYFFNTEILGVDKAEQPESCSWNCESKKHKKNDWNDFHDSIDFFHLSFFLNTISRGSFYAPEQQLTCASKSMRKNCCAIDWSYARKTRIDLVYEWNWVRRPLCWNMLIWTGFRTTNKPSDGEEVLSGNVLIRYIVYFI